MSIERLRQAIARADYYGAPSDDSPIMADQDNCMFELLHSGETTQLTLGDLRAILAETPNAE